MGVAIFGAQASLLNTKRRGRLDHAINEGTLSVSDSEGGSVKHAPLDDREPPPGRFVTTPRARQRVASEASVEASMEASTEALRAHRAATRARYNFV
jgi:hypothetical protein